MNTDSDQTRILRLSLSAQRREMASRSLFAFCRIYMPAHFKLPPSSMHRDFFTFLERITSDRGARLAIAAPRGHAKSTIVSLAYALWCICYLRERFIILISNTASQANDLLTHIKTELESNGRLIDDFPDVAEEPGRKPGPDRWRLNEIITRNGVRVSAFGAEMKIRGRRYRQNRPTLILIDDLENEEQVSSADRREKLNNWVMKAVLKAGDSTTNAVVVGTIMHYDSLLSHLVNEQKSPGWMGRKYQAVTAWSPRVDLWERWQRVHDRVEENDGRVGPKAALEFFSAHEKEMTESTAVLWPESESYYKLMVLRATEGTISFDSEKQNDPIDPASCLFRTEEMTFWDDTFKTAEDLIKALADDMEIFGACDPSMGRQGRNNDPSAIVSILRHRKTKLLYVLDSDIALRPPDKIIADIIAYEKIREYSAFGVEANNFQGLFCELLSRQARDANVRLDVREITNTKDKVARIQALQPLVKSGTLQFSRRHLTLLEQLRQFPKGRHDDGPDALEMAASMAVTAPEPIVVPSFDDMMRYATPPIFPPLGYSLFPMPSPPPSQW